MRNEAVLKLIDGLEKDGGHSGNTYDPDYYQGWADALATLKDFIEAGAQL